MKINQPGKLIAISFLMCLIQACTLQPPVTREEALAFARQLEQSVAVKNPAVFNNMFDLLTLRDRIRTASEGKMDRAALKEIPDAIRNRRMGDELIKMIREGDIFQLVKPYEKEGNQHLIFRYFGSYGLNYYDLELIHADNQTKVADMYMYSTGENYSKTIAEAIVHFQNYFTGTGTMKQDMKTLKIVNRLMQENKAEEAMKLFDGLSEGLKNQKSMQLKHVQIASQLEESAYKEAIDQFEKLYPNEPSMYLLMNDAHILRGEHDKAVDDINKIDRLLGGDPFLDFYRGNIYNKKGDKKKALAYYKLVYKRMPDFANNMVELIGLYMDMGNSKDAGRVFATLKNTKGSGEQNVALIEQLYPELNENQSVDQ